MISAEVRVRKDAAFLLIYIYIGSRSLLQSR